MSGSTMKNARNMVRFCGPTQMSSMMIKLTMGSVRSSEIMGSTKSRTMRTRYATSASSTPAVKLMRKPTAMRAVDARLITQKLGFTTWAASASSVRMGPASTRRLPMRRSATSHTANQNRMMPARLRRPRHFSRRATAAAPSSSAVPVAATASARTPVRKASASSSPSTPEVRITPIARSSAAPKVRITARILSGVAPLPAAVRTMNAIWSSGKPF